MTKKFAYALPVGAALLVLEALTTPSWAYTEPAAGKLDDRVRFVDFAPYQVTRIVSDE